MSEPHDPAPERKWTDITADLIDGESDQIASDAAGTESAATTEADLIELADHLLVDSLLRFVHESDRTRTDHRVESTLAAIRQQSPAPPQRQVTADTQPRAAEHRRGTTLDWLAARIHWRRHPGYFTAAVLLIAATCWLAFYAVVSFRVGPQRPIAAGPDVADGIVARLVRIDGARWGEFVPNGRGMTAGQQLVLVSGLAELRYETGAIVILEGPVEFWVGSNAELGTRNAEQSEAPSSNRGYLKLGKLVARVKVENAQGFTVDTPAARVVDFGTEFGVEVDGQGNESVAVFEGAVVLETTGAAGGTRRRQTLRANEQATIAQSGNSVAVQLHVGQDARDRFIQWMPGQGPKRVIDENVEPTFVAFHDLGGEPSPGNITTQRDVAATIDLIRFTDGSDTGIDFRIAGVKSIGTRTGTVTRPPSAGTPAGELFLASGIDLDDGIVSKKGGTMTFTFTGMDRNQLYDVALYGDRNERADGVERFTLNGAAAATNRSSTGIVRTGVTELETRPNATAGHVARWTDIDPGGDGSITIDIRTSGTNIAYITAVRLAEHTALPGDTNKESE